MKYSHYFSLSVKSVALTLAAFAALVSSAVTIPNTPLVTQVSAKPMVMLVAGKDHKLFYEAYNDAGDIDGDGAIDVRFKPSITYYGLFDPKVCYTHNNNATNTGLFTPVAAVADSLNTCAQPTVANRWSGNWLNYITTARIDSMRKVLYGGYREVDSATQTILRRAYIPQDAHSWAKEYTSAAYDGYKIKDYTPIDPPTAADKKHFFGNLTANASTNCANLNDCSGMPPLMSVVTNSSKRVWEWASKERPVLDGSHGGARTNYTVRVEVCTATFNEGCKKYGSVFKPTGLLHEYGETDAMLFGLITGSYDKNMSGGLLRKVVSSFKDEVDPANGIFTSNANIVKTFDNLRIRDFNNSRTDQAYRGGWLVNAPMAQGAFPDWGNPIGEMLYEGVRYFAGKALPSTDFTSGGAVDAQVGLSTVAWDDPYSSASKAKAPRCAKANFLTISDINPSFDSDQLPGTSFGVFGSDMSAVDVTKEADFISSVESGVVGQRFIGESLANTPTADSAPTVKNITSLGTIRGLAPEEPTKQGSYYAASVASFAKRNDLRGDLAGSQNIDTFAVALASPLPRMEVPIPGGKKITLVPFAKSVGGGAGGGTISNAKASFQPTNQIVDFYVETIANSYAGSPDSNSSVNGGRFYAKFRINYEDVEQGADHDMDAIVEYEVTANSDDTVTVILKPTYQAGSIQHSMGYIISGTTKDGVYLVVQDENVNRPYFLNVPPGKDPGHCNVATMPAECNTLPNKDWTGAKESNIKFTASSTSGATLLKDPLWYAAKWGGFNDLNPGTGQNVPDLAGEWDTNGDGVPDTYFLVQNPLKLKDALKRAFDAIFKTNSSASNVIANSSSVSSTTRVFQARFNAVRWSGDLVAYPITSDGVSGNQDWNARLRMPAPGARKLFVRTTGGTTTPFDSSSLPAADRALLGDNPTTTTIDESQDVVSYLRGDRTNEVQGSGGIFRTRAQDTVLGDIVHSAPYYEKDSDTVYVGANDGMLHAFKASDGTVPGSAGTELFGFIPSEAIPRLKNTAATGYVHEYFVDGDVTVSPKTTETGNKNLLFAAMGRGGKGLFSLDVTNPTAFDATKFLWEYTPTGSSAAAADNDLGLMLGRPVYAKMNNGTAAIIMGNGYNSTTGTAALYIFLLNTSGALTSVVKLDTFTLGDNGLATPGVIDADGNGTIDYIYAGDLKGNVWKFDVSGATTASWKVDLSPLPLTPNPLFKARDASNNPQPITAPVTVAVNTDLADPNAGKRFIFFGTGSYFQSGDPTNTAIQTWYGLIDQGAVIADRSNMQARTIAATGTFAGKPVRAFSVAGTNDMAGKYGWHLDFTGTPPGERMVTEPVAYRLATTVLVASSIIPSGDDPCIPGGTGYVNALNPFTGGALGVGILDVNNNKNYKDDTLSGLFIGSVDLGVGLPSRPTLIGNRLVVGGTNPDDKNPISDVGVNLGFAPIKGRISWREIIKD